MVIDDKDFHPGLCDTRHKAVELPGRTSVILQETCKERPYRLYPKEKILELGGRVELIFGLRGIWSGQCGGRKEPPSDSELA